MRACLPFPLERAGAVSARGREYDPLRLGWGAQSVCLLGANRQPREKFAGRMAAPVLWIMSSRRRTILKPKFKTAWALILLALAAAGCTSERLYATGRSTQRNQCERMPNQYDREKCLRDADMSQDEYKREAESVGK